MTDIHCFGHLKPWSQAAYRIEVEGRLSRSSADRFAGMRITTRERLDQSIVTCLTGLVMDQNFPQRPFFADTHLHKAQSFDAVSFGTILGPEEAYRFARGEEVTSSTGVRGKLSRPLDFLVVTDHAENMGTMGARGDDRCCGA